MGDMTPLPRTWPRMGYKALIAAGIQHVEQLQDYSEIDLLRLKNFGMTTLQVIRADMEASGLRFATPAHEQGPSTGAWVYFIQCGEFVKIGRTENVRDRVSQLSTACPHRIEVIGLIPCSPRQAGTKERELHRLFRPFHHRGEWFHLEPEIVDYVALLPEEKW